MLTIIFFWVLLAAIIWGIGFWAFKVFYKYLGEVYFGRIDKFETFWLGFVLLVVFLQIYSLFFPINDTTFFIGLVPLIIFLIFSGKRLISNLKEVTQGYRINQKSLYFFILLALVTFTLAYSAWAETTYYDTLLYHLNGVKWASTFKAVAGLVQLHFRLAFNSSFLLWAAFTDFWKFQDASSHVALSFLFVAVNVQWFYAIFSNKGISIQKLFCIFTLPFILINGWSFELSSLSTDLASSIIVLLFCYYALGTSKNYPILVIGLAAIATVFKLSAAIIIPIGVILAIAFIRQNDSKKILKALILPMVILALVMIGFIARNVVLSGWLLYPGFGNLNLPWSPTPVEVKNVTDTIKAWGRSPGPGYREALTMGFREWFFPWLKSNQSSLEIRFFLLGLVAAIITGYLGLYRKFSGLLRTQFGLMYLLCLGSFVLFIFQAPLIRFTSIYFWIFLTLGLIPFALDIFKSGTLGRYIVYAFPLIVLLNLAGNGPNVEKTLDLFWVRKELSREVVQVNAALDPNEQSVNIWIPKDGDQCGNSPIPCAPRLQNLILRDNADFSKGFLEINR